MPCDRAQGIICDQRIALNGHYASKHYPEQIRRIRYKDAESGKTLIFLTNHMTLPALTICALYKKRWQVELFLTWPLHGPRPAGFAFGKVALCSCSGLKWIKQHLRIKRYMGTSENAVKTQIWCAVATYVLIAIDVLECPGPANFPYWRASPWSRTA